MKIPGPAGFQKFMRGWIWAAVIGHTAETPFAYFAAKKRGLDPLEYVLRTMALGVITLIPLLRKPTREEAT